MGQYDPALLKIQQYLKRTKETGTPPPLPPPRPAHDWYEKMYAKLFSDTDNLYNTMTASDFEQQAIPLLALLIAVTRQLKLKPQVGGDSDMTNAVGWPDWFNEMQGNLVIQPTWAWLQEECHRLLYMYACWHLASGEQDDSVFQPIPTDPPPPPPAKKGKVKENAAAKVIEATENAESGADTADSGYVEFHEDEAPSDGSPPPSWKQIPLIACAAEDEGPGGAGEPYKPNGKARMVPKANRGKLPLNIEYMFRYLGKSGVNAKSMTSFVFREKALNTNVTRIEELGYGIGNWCGPASWTPIKEQLKKRYVFPVGLDHAFENQWGYARRITYKYYSAEKVEHYQKMAKPDANLTDDGKFVKIEDLKVERGDVIWMINQVGPLSGHVATIIRSQDASGDESKTDAMVTWVSGNAGGAPGGCVRVQTVWRVLCEDPKYDYDDISKLGNRRDERRFAYNHSGVEKDQQLQNSGDALNTSKGNPDESTLSDDQKDKLAAERKAEEAVKDGTTDIEVRPTRKYTHWMVALFKITKLDLVGIAGRYDPLVTTWMARRPLTSKGEPQHAELTDEEKALLGSENDWLRPQMLMWTPPDCNRNAILLAGQSDVDKRFPAFAKRRKAAKK